MLVCNLGGTYDAQAEQVEVGTAIHGAFDQLQSVNVPFDRSVAPGMLKCSKNGFFVAAEMLGEVCQRACGSGIYANATRQRRPVAG